MTRPRKEKDKDSYEYKPDTKVTEQKQKDSSIKKSLLDYVRDKTHEIMTKEVDNEYKLKELKDLTIDLSEGQVFNEEYNDVGDIISSALESFSQHKRLPSQETKEYNFIKSLELLLKEQLKLLDKKGNYNTLPAELSSSLGDASKQYIQGAYGRVGLYEILFGEDYNKVLTNETKKSVDDYTDKIKRWSKIAGAGFSTTALGTLILFAGNNTDNDLIKELINNYNIHIGVGSVSGLAFAILGFIKSSQYQKKSKEIYNILRNNVMKILSYTDTIK